PKHRKLQLLAKTSLKIRICFTCRDSQGWTPLHHAAFYGHLPLVKFLLHRGTDVNSRDFSNCTPLHRATWSGKTLVVEYLLQSGASQSIKSCSGQTPLHLAAAHGNLEVAQTLLEFKAEVNCKDLNKWTPLHWAAFNNNQDLIDLLLNKCAALNERNSNGMSPLHLAVCAENENATEHLLGKGADVNARCENGQTALHLWARGHVELIKLLLDNGADPSLESQWKETPADLAAQQKHRHVTQVLEAHTKMQSRPNLQYMLSMTLKYHHCLFLSSFKLALCYFQDSYSILYKK
uniref:Uncharacterized protein n=1 Tax=Erpetoichthys calabaricus TaxID=27687 RepID=A0A8C4X9I0_ERPCA